MANKFPEGTGSRETRYLALLISLRATRHQSRWLLPKNLLLFVCSLGCCMRCLPIPKRYDIIVWQYLCPGSSKATEQSIWAFVEFRSPRGYYEDKWTFNAFWSHARTLRSCFFRCCRKLIRIIDRGKVKFLSVFNTRHSTVALGLY